eukprot:COSAG02_NODE_50813_length_318_cov_0.707763_1_plen_70_part_10
MGCGASTPVVQEPTADVPVKPVGETARSEPAQAPSAGAAPTKPQETRKTRRGSVEAELNALDDDVTMAVD